MKLFSKILSSILLLSLSLLLVESSNEFKITRGSSISTSPSNESNGTYWLSSSGNIAFGFYPLCYDCHRYVIGIWFIKSAENVLVWSANRNGPPLHHPSSVLLNNDGKLILQTAGSGDKPLLLDVSEPVSYAVMHDNGNFVLYGYNSQIIWESFNNPTDTILSGQKLDVSYFDRSYRKYMLRVNQYDRNFAVYKRYTWLEDSQKWKTNPGKKFTLVTLNLDYTGRLYIVNSNGLLVQNLSKGEERPQWQQQPVDDDDNGVIYRATLENNGMFCLYRERIGREGEKSIQIWDQYDFPELKWVLIGAFLIIACTILVGLCIISARIYEIKLRWPTIPNWLKIKFSREKEEDPEKDPKISLKKELLS